MMVFSACIPFLPLTWPRPLIGGRTLCVRGTAGARMCMDDGNLIHSVADKLRGLVL